MIISTSTTNPIVHPITPNILYTYPANPALRVGGYINIRIPHSLSIKQYGKNRQRWIMECCSSALVWQVSMNVSFKYWVVWKFSWRVYWGRDLSVGCLRCVNFSSLSFSLSIRCDYRTVNLSFPPGNITSLYPKADLASVP
jgi:hypothetical protein